jgi:hypothetical protein
MFTVTSQRRNLIAFPGIFWRGKGDGAAIFMTAPYRVSRASSGD